MYHTYTANSIRYRKLLADYHFGPIKNHAPMVIEASSSPKEMITLEDIIEELVGEMHDEFDRIPTLLNRAGDGWITGGFVLLNTLRDTAGISLEAVGDKPLYTLNDWVYESLGRQPKGGDTIDSDCCQIVVRKTRNVMVQEAFLLPRKATET
jgi:putative hemolysin